MSINGLKEQKKSCAYFIYLFLKKGHVAIKRSDFLLHIYSGGFFFKPNWTYSYAVECFIEGFSHLFYEHRTSTLKKLDKYSGFLLTLTHLFYAALYKD